MIRLDSTVSLQCVLAGAVATTQPQVTVCASDHTSPSTYVGLAPVRTTLNSTTDVTVLSAPAGGTVRDVDYFSCFNRDTATVTVTVKYDATGVDTIITTFTLLTLETLLYIHGAGWMTMAANGGLKTVASASGILLAVNGGTGFGSYAVGDLLYADTTTTLAKLADVAVGSYLRSGGVGVAPLWSTTTLPNAATTGNLLYASAANVYSNLSIGTATQVLQGGTIPTWTSTLDISGAAGGQISFPATQNASAGANVLDDYEEGTWTPTIGGVTTPGTQTYSDQIGRYVKIGRLVSVECRIVMSAKDAATAGSLEIFGLPFTAAALANAAAGMATATTSSLTLTALYTQVGIQILPGTTTAFFIQNGSAQAAAAIASATGLAATSAVVMGGSYST